MIPKKFNWLTTIGVLPRLVQAAIEYIGLKEVPGQKNNPVIMQMAEAVGVADIYKNDDTSWCALFISFLCKKTNKPLPLTKDKYDYIRAAWFLKYGNPVRSGDEKLGDILVFQRTGGNHVGIYIAESKDTFYVLGGNQGNSVSIAEISKFRLREARRFYATGGPASVKKYYLDTSGKVSTNEA